MKYSVKVTHGKGCYNVAMEETISGIPVDEVSLPDTEALISYLRKVDDDGSTQVCMTPGMFSTILSEREPPPVEAEDELPLDVDEEIALKTAVALAASGQMKQEEEHPTEE